MSAVVVLDASAAVRAVMDAAAQPSLLDRLAAASAVCAPALLRVEAANALWKYRRASVVDTAEALARHAEASALVHRFVDEQTLFPEALQLAAELDHPGVRRRVRRHRAASRCHAADLRSPPARLVHTGGHRL